MVRAYNDWLAEFCAADPTRLFGVAALPFQDPVAAATELRRAHEQLGFGAAFVCPNPCAGRTIVDPANEIVWETAEELDVTIGIHEGSQPAIPNARTRPRATGSNSSPPTSPPNSLLRKSVVRYTTGRGANGAVMRSSDAAIRSTRSRSRRATTGHESHVG